MFRQHENKFSCSPKLGDSAGGGGMGGVGGEDIDLGFGIF